eukprot:TRINITY_DN9405_c0_g1_i3.p1 TRINITY_DN9405_c0_g1~~TRINITY_DN9405_c0_g1_i3.p1  ORF type:complete len:263 (-),score=74.91 TRINITY_DN9405_c0_g1_i3:458-1246(-)
MCIRDRYQRRVRGEPSFTMVYTSTRKVTRNIPSKTNKTVVTKTTTSSGPNNRRTTTTTTTTTTTQRALDNDIHRVRNQTRQVPARRSTTTTTTTHAPSGRHNVSAQAAAMERRGVVAPYQTKPEKVVTRSNKAGRARAPAPAPAPRRAPAPAPAPAPRRRTTVSSGGSKVSTSELKSLFAKVGNGQGIYKKQVEAWFLRIEGAADGIQKRALQTRAHSTFTDMTGSANSTCVTPQNWNVWCADQRRNLGEAGFRQWYNKWSR